MNELILSNTEMPLLLSCGHLLAHEPFFHADRITDFHVIIYGINDTIYVTEDGIDHEVGAGDIFFLKSGVHHYGKYEIRRGTEWYFAHFRAHSPSGGSTMELPKKLSGMQKSEAVRLFSNLIDSYGSEDAERKWNEHAMLFSLLSEIAFYHKKAVTPHTVIDDICEYLSENHTRPFSAAELEEHFFLSYKHMAFLFKKEKGMTMQQFHTKIRMEHAQKLLLSTLLPIGEVAHAIGYNDMLYFSRMFKKYTGLNPTEFRRQPFAY